MRSRIRRWSCTMATVRWSPRMITGAAIRKLRLLRPPFPRRTTSKAPFFEPFHRGIHRHRSRQQQFNGRGSGRSVSVAVRGERFATDALARRKAGWEHRGRDASKMLTLLCHRATERTTCESSAAGTLSFSTTRMIDPPSHPPSRSYGETSGYSESIRERAA
jgi:hypothetical protein